jgi:hypothetical protein
MLRKPLFCAHIRGGSRFLSKRERNPCFAGPCGHALAAPRRFQAGEATSGLAAVNDALVIEG